MADLGSHHVGTAFEPLPEDAEAGAAFKPVWQQEVRDKQGRRRFHGAFTGGFSAGYFNSCGTEQGWAPTTFASSRSSRTQALQQRPEDFMDEDDDPMMGRKLAARKEFDHTREAQDRQAVASAAAAGSSIPGPIPAELIAPKSVSVGKRLLQRMGWREGQGVGPRQKPQRPLRVSRWGGQGGVRAPAAAAAATAADAASGADGVEADDGFDPYALGHDFAPKNVPVVEVRPKADAYGLGYDPALAAPEVARYKQRGLFGPDPATERRTLAMGDVLRSGREAGAAGVGLGALEDADDPDIYVTDSLGNYDRELGGPPPTFTILDDPQRSEKLLLMDAEAALQRCSDGRPPLPGFRLAARTRPSVRLRRYRPPVPPKDFRPVHKFTEPGPLEGAAAAAARGSKYRHGMNASARLAALGERTLPALNAAEVAEQQRQAKAAREEAEQRHKQRLSGLGTQMQAAIAARFTKAAEGAGAGAGSIGSGGEAGLRPGGSASSEGGEVTREVMQPMVLPGGLVIPARRPEPAASAGGGAAAAAGPKKPPAVRRVPWEPARLLCKRFNVKDPYADKARPSVTSTAAATPAGAGDTMLAWQRAGGAAGARAAAAASTAAAAPGASGGGAVEEFEPPSVQRPAVDLFKAIFEDSEAEEEEEEEEAAAAAAPAAAAAAAAAKPAAARRSVMDELAEEPDEVPVAAASPRREQRRSRWGARAEGGTGDAGVPAPPAAAAPAVAAAAPAARPAPAAEAATPAAAAAAPAVSAPRVAAVLPAPPHSPITARPSRGAALGPALPPGFGARRDGDGGSGAAGGGGAADNSSDSGSGSGSGSESDASARSRRGSRSGERKHRHKHSRTGSDRERKRSGKERRKHKRHSSEHKRHSGEHKRHSGEHKHKHKSRR